VVSFDDSMKASVDHWRFEPATVDGEAVASEIELSLRPAMLRTMEKPEYPSRAIELGLEGVVRLSAVVGTDGRVSSVTVLESSGKTLLDRAATAAVKRWTFAPARVNGRPAACTVEIRPIRFKLD
jgi:protein TonB